MSVPPVGSLRNHWAAASLALEGGRTSSISQGSDGLVIRKFWQVPEGPLALVGRMGQLNNQKVAQRSLLSNHF